MTRSVPRSRLEFIRLAHPNARITERGGKQVVIIPTYDIETDTAGETILAIHDDPETRKPEPGDILTDIHGNTFQIMNPAHFVPVRKGPKAEF